MENLFHGKTELVGVVIDWDVKVSRDFEVTQIRPLSLDHARNRLSPSYLPTGELHIVVPAMSEDTAKERATNIAKQIASAGFWGEEIWNFSNFLESIEALL